LKEKKYNKSNLLPALRLFAEARNKALESGFTDNGGAIHSVERIVDMLSVSIKYPYLSHINNYKKHPESEASVNAQVARQKGEPVKIEHVMPQRAFARKIIELIDKGLSDDAIVEFISDNYRLVLLTDEETKIINKLNRSKITKDRIADAGIEIYQ